MEAAMDQCPELEACRLTVEADPRIYNAIAYGTPLTGPEVRAAVRRWTAEAEPGLDRRALEAKTSKEVEHLSRNRPPVPFLQSAMDTVLDRAGGDLRADLEQIVAKAREGLRDYGREHCTFGLEDCFYIERIPFEGARDGKAEYGEGTEKEKAEDDRK